MKIWRSLTFYKETGAEKELREASLAAAEKFDAFGIKLWMRQDFYFAVKAYKDQAEASEEFTKLGPED